MDTDNEVEDGDDDLFMDTMVQEVGRTARKSKKAAGSRLQKPKAVVNDPIEYEADGGDSEEELE